MLPHGYPYFIQLFGVHTFEQWQRAGGGPLLLAHVEPGLSAATDAVDSLYEGRFERLSDEARRFVITMADARGDQPAPIALIAERMGRQVTAVTGARDPDSASSTRRAVRAGLPAVRAPVVRVMAEACRSSRAAGPVAGGAGARKGS